MALTRVKGSSWDTSDNLVAGIISDLATVEPEGIIFVSGALRENDGNGGWFKYDPNELRSNADGMLIIDPSGTSAGRGCWIRQRYKTDGPGLNVSEVQTAAAGQQDFRLQQVVYAPGTGSLAIYVNGTRLTPFSFTETSPTTVEVAVPLRAGDVVEFLHFEQPTGGGHLNLTALQIAFDTLGTGITSINVQGALQELDAAIAAGGGGGGGGSHPGTALSIPYLPVAPDISNNVQDGMHWIQNQALSHIRDLNAAHIANAIAYNPGLSGLHGITVQDALDELATNAGSGTAAGTSFDNSVFPASPDNLQGTTEDLYVKVGEGLLELNQHLTDPIDAHKARAITLESTSPIFVSNGVSDVGTAFDILADAMSIGDIDASRVIYDQSVTNLGANIQMALTTLFSQSQGHINDTVNAHHATAIKYTATPGSLLAGNVSGALDELFTIQKQHTLSHSAHTAKDIRFNPATSSMLSTNVEAAILEAVASNKVFRGHLDITQAYFPPTVAFVANDYFLVTLDGTADATWQAQFANTIPTPIKQGDALIFDGTKFWYTAVQQSLVNALVRNPAPGVSQVIQIADGADTGLIIAGGITNQVAPVLELGGNARVHGDVIDDLGSLRQISSEVLYNNAASGLTATDVKTAIDEVHTYQGLHISGNIPASRHKADAITFQPVAGITALDVQAAIRAVQHNLLNHESVAGSHTAQRITFDNSGTILVGQTVQEVVLELLASGGTHPTNPIDAHPASAISFNGSISGSSAVNAQQAIDEALLTVTFDTIDGGIF